VKKLAELLVLCFLAACSPPSNNLDFRAPAGWMYFPPIVAFGFQTWRAEDGSGGTILLKRTTLTPATFRPLQNARICGSHPAHSFRVLDKSSGKPLIIEGFSSDWGPTRYTAVYLRPAGTASDPAAETAIRSLCPKRPR